MHTFRTIGRLMICLALATGCTNAPGDYDPSWEADEAFTEGGKADGLLDAAPTIAFGETASGTIDGDNLDLYRIELGRTDVLRVTVDVTDGDLNPHLGLYRGTSTYIGSDDWELTGQTLVKTYTAELAGTYFFMVRPYRNQGSGSYEITVECTGGLCAGVTPPPVEREMTVGDVDSCLDSALRCAFDALPRYNGRVGDARAASIFQRCLDTVEGGECGTSCDFVNPDDDWDNARELCDDMVRSLPHYADQTTECHTVVMDCLDDCADGNYGDADELAYATMGMCWMNGFNGTCDGYARELDVCGGEVDSNSAAACYEQCESTIGVWYDDLDGICSDDTDCADYCDVDVAEATAHCGGTLNVATEDCVTDRLDNLGAWGCIEDVEDRLTSAQGSTCSFTQTPVFGATDTEGLLASSTESRTLDLDNRAYGTLWRQVVQMGVHLMDYERSGEYADSYAEIIEQVDDNTVTRHVLEIDGAQYDWLRLAQGGTQVGVVYERNTIHMVAEITDGSVIGCTPL